MTLIELLNIYDGKKVYIGCYSGSAWLYCGEKNVEKIELTLSGSKNRLIGLRDMYRYRVNANNDPTNKRIIGYIKNLKNVERKLEEWIPPLNREVVFIYTLISEPDAIAILIAGEESGSTWWEGDKNV